MRIRKPVPAIMRWLTRRNKRDMISYRTLRLLIGILGMLLPFALLFVAWIVARYPLQSSISIYYYLNSGDLFVGVLSLVGVFLMTYKGFDFLDNLVTFATGVLGIGVALFPCDDASLYGPVSRSLSSASAQEPPVGVFGLAPGVSDSVHMACAVGFFLLLAINSIFLFTRMHDGYPSRARVRRKLLYVFCGLAIIACMAAVYLAFKVLPTELVYRSGLVFWLETGCLVAFGTSWLVKSGLGSKLESRAKGLRRLRAAGKKLGSGAV